MEPRSYLSNFRWVAVILVAGALILGGVIVYTPALSLLGIGGTAPSTCTPSETPLASEWANWEHQGDLPFGLYDPVIFVEPDREYPYRVLVAPDDGRMDLYRSQDMESFELVADGVEGDEFASNFNWGQKVDGRYYLFRTLREEQTELWTGESLTNLTNRGVILEEGDTGGFYDAETETWHIYYQTGAGESRAERRFGPNTDVIGHATSTDAREWTRQEPALNVSDRPWKVGDPDVIRIDDRYYMFLDQTTRHPVYNIQLATSENLSRFSPVGRVTEVCGGDAKVRYLPSREEFVMLTEFSGSDISGVGISTSPGPGEPNTTYRLDGRQDVIVTTNTTDDAASVERRVAGRP